jgi:deaminated glutathione amidase
VPTPSRSLTAAALQFAAGTDVEKNLSCIADLVAEAAASGAELVVLPEAAMYAWDAPADDLAAAAHTWGAAFVTAIVELAKTHGLVIVAGLFAPAADDDRPYNRLVVAGPHGVQDTYDKVHLYDAFAYAESQRVRPGAIHPDGSELVTVQVSGFTVGLLNCYDLRFPEMARALVDRGADVLAVSSAWVAGPHKEMHWELLLRSRAIENTCYVLAACQPPPTSTGLSMAIDPMGLVMSTCTRTEGVVAAKLSQQHLADVRSVLPCLDNRRYSAQDRPSPTTSRQGE